MTQLNRIDTAIALNGDRNFDGGVFTLLVYVCVVLTRLLPQKPPQISHHNTLFHLSHDLCALPDMIIGTLPIVLSTY